MTDMREVLADIIRKNVLSTRNDDGMGVYRAADAIMAELTNKVKPLVWEKAGERHFDKGHCHGYTEEIAYLAPLDWYRIYPASDGKWRWVRQFRMTYIEGNNSKEPELDSAEAAKAAAQAHYVATVLAAFGVQGGDT